MAGSAGPEAVELARLCGLELDEWQQFILEVALSERVDKTWAARIIDLICGRQNGKNAVIEARELFGLVVLGEWIIHTSHEFKTTKDSYKKLLDLVQGHPDVEERLEYQVASPASGYEMRFRGGGRITFIARSRRSGRGLTGDLLVLDEAQDLDEDALGALTPTLSARSTRIPGTQTWFTGSAPGPTALVWHSRRAKGRDGGSPDGAYFEFSASPNANLDDRDAWAQANPGLNLRITEDYIQAQERDVMSDEMFARERLSVSPDLSELRQQVFPAGVWERACSKNVAQPTTGLVFSVDVNPERTAAALAVAGGGGSVGVTDCRPGVGWVVDEVIRVARTHHAAVAIASAGPAGALIPDIERAGVIVIPVPPGAYRDACGFFYDSVMENRVAIQRLPALDDAVTYAERKPSGDAWVWNRRAGGDISPLVAATIALFVASAPTAVPSIVNLSDFADDDWE